MTEVFLRRYYERRPYEKPAAELIACIEAHVLIHQNWDPVRKHYNFETYYPVAFERNEEGKVIKAVEKKVWVE